MCSYREVIWFTGFSQKNLPAKLCCYFLGLGIILNQVKTTEKFMSLCLLIGICTGKNLYIYQVTNAK